MHTARRPSRLPQLVISLFLALAAFPLAAQQTQTPKEKELAEFILASYTKYEYRIPMRDGERLFTVRLRAEGRLGAAVPDPARPHAVQRRRPTASTSTRRRSGRRAAVRAREGYIFVYQDVRGRCMSEGEFVDVRPHDPAKGATDIDESTDT